MEIRVENSSLCSFANPYTARPPGEVPLEADTSWIDELESQVIAELAANRDQLHRSGRRLFDVRAEDLPLPSFAAFRRKLQEQLEGGRGFAVIRGPPVQTRSEDQAALLFWGLGVHSRAAALLPSQTCQS